MEIFSLRIFLQAARIILNDPVAQYLKNVTTKLMSALGYMAYWGICRQDKYDCFFQNVGYLICEVSVFYSSTLGVDNTRYCVKYAVSLVNYIIIIIYAYARCTAGYWS